LVTERGNLETTISALSEQLGEANGMIESIRQDAASTADGAAGQLIEVLGRVRDVAKQASLSVRDTLGGVVDEAVASLERANVEMLTRQAEGPVAEQIAALDAAGERAATAAEASASRLSQAVVSVAETASALEARVREADERLDEAEKLNLAQQSELLVEALNSNAIDITKALSTEVTEGAWTQYLAGDRSVFTRRAARLVESSDAKAISRRFEEEPEFREAVRRYIHDFEAMMRRVTGDRDGTAFSVTLLSSDLGKLYVALAQSTERLRR
ncbi:MAG: hypothetical protein WA906_10655, partial [Pacificimonas sp.]